MILKRRHCRIWPSISLALLLSLLNTVIILLYLGPLHLTKQDTYPSQTILSEIQKKTIADGQLHHHSTDSVVESKSQAQTPNSDIFTMEIKHEELHSIQRWPQSINRNTVLVANQPTNNLDVHHEFTTESKATNNMEVFTDWSDKHAVAGFKDDENLDHAYKQLKFNKNVMLMVGEPPKHPVEIVIGIPTIKRTTSQYLSSTLKQLVQHLGYNNTKQCHIVVFSADFNDSENQKTAKFIEIQFKKEVRAGLIEVIKPDKAYYPKLTDLPVLWKDKPDRIRWRSKQCIDYSLLFAYCRHFGKYYLQLEDDIIVSQGYFDQMKLFIRSRNSIKWSNLQFGRRGFIGMLYKSRNIGRLALFLKMYYWVFPVDILFRHFNDIHLTGNGADSVHSPPLFRHVGVESSLKGQTRKLEDFAKVKTKYINKRLYKDANNPQSFISTNIEVVGSNTIDGPYRSINTRVFWGKDVKISDFVLIEFMEELTLLRVIFDTGSAISPEDLIGEGKFETSVVSKDGGCDWKRFILFESRRDGGKIDASATKFGGIPGVKCIRLTITKLNKNKIGKPTWLLIREIAVWSQ